MTRPDPRPIKWETTYSDNRVNIFYSELLDGSFYLIKTHHWRKDKYTYEIVDIRASGFPTASRPTAAELVKFLVESCPFIGGPEVYAALASITSNEDWENLDA